MFSNVSSYEAVDLLLRDEYAGWSPAGARVLIEHLEQLEEDLGEPIEFDRVAFRCDYSEYSSLEEVASDYNLGDLPLDELEDHIRDNGGDVIEFDGGVIIRNF